jgi:hypothetical protein
LRRAKEKNPPFGGLFSSKLRYLVRLSWGTARGVRFVTFSGGVTSRVETDEPSWEMDPVKELNFTLDFSTIS